MDIKPQELVTELIQNLNKDGIYKKYTLDMKFDAQQFVIGKVSLKREEEFEEIKFEYKGLDEQAARQAHLLEKVSRDI